MRSPVALALVLAVAACGGAPKSSGPHVVERRIEAPPDQPSSIITLKEDPKPEPWHPSEGGDAPVAYVRDERSSRLDVLMPKGRVKEAWRSPLALADAPAVHAAFVLAAGNRIAVTSTDAWVLFDTNGLRIAGHEMETPAVRIDRASGAIVPDDVRAADLPADAKTASKNGMVVMVRSGAVNVGERAIEGKFEGLEVAIDDNAAANVLVKQGDELSLWTIPSGGNTAIGRHKLGKKRTPVRPPVLGKTVRVFVLETGLVSYSLDGKKLWERKGVPSGGVTITIDDQALVADQGKIYSLDKKGRVTEIWSASDVVFSTPPILNAQGLLLCASAESLHAFSFQ